MANPLSIPVEPGTPWQSMSIALDGATYVLEFRWNDREHAWYMDVRAEDASPIVVGVKVVLDWPLGHRCADARMPAGVFFAKDTSNTNTPPGLDDLGARVRLVYYSVS